MKSVVLNSFMSEQTQSKNSGNHALCFEHPSSRNKVLLSTNCKARAEMIKPTFIKSEYFPKNMRKVGEFMGTTVYEMEKYEHFEGNYNPTKPKKMSKYDFKIYTMLQKVWNLQSIKDTKLPKRLKAQLIAAFRQLSANIKEKVDFDICHHNVMVTKHGKLVLNDLFWVHQPTLKTAVDTSDNPQLKMYLNKYV